MELSAQSTQAVSEIRQAPRLHRVGDVVLFLIWVVFAASSATAAFEEGQANDLLASAHRGMVAVVFLVNAVLFLIRGSAVRRTSDWRSLLVALIGAWAVVPLALLPLTWRPDWLLGLTTVGMIAAYLFVLWALLTLRRSFSIFPEARTLVRHGPYALVRHPLYAAYMLTYLLILLPRLGLLSLPLAAAGIACEMLRARNEERLLAASFPDYADYAAATPRFVPRVG